MNGTLEAFRVTGKKLTPEEQSIFRGLVEEFIKDDQKVSEFTSEVLGYVDKENKSDYQMKIENHLNYLGVKLMKGEITQEEFDRLTKETIKNANLIIDTEFSVLNKEYANMGNDIIKYRNLTDEDKQLFKEEFLNIINQAQGKELKPTDDKIIKVLDHFIPEAEQENFFEFIEKEKNKPKKEPEKEIKQNGQKTIIEVIGGGAGYTDVL